jgi:hypothetical protein
MMHFIAPALVLFSMVCLTVPNSGHGVWLSKDQIVSILHGEHDCAKGANAKVTLGNGTFACVQETPQQVLKKLDEAK